MFLGATGILGTAGGPSIGRAASEGLVIELSTRLPGWNHAGVVFQD